MGPSMSTMGKAKCVWKEESLKDLAGDIREQRLSLSFLLDCVNTYGNYLTVLGKTVSDLCYNLVVCDESGHRKLPFSSAVLNWGKPG